MTLPTGQKHYKMRETGIINFIAHIKIFLGNGMGYVSDFKYPVLLAITLKVYLPNQSNLILFFISLIAMILMVLVGWIDLKFIKLAQTTACISTSKYNPYFEKLGKDLNSVVGNNNNGKRGGKS